MSTPFPKGQHVIPRMHLEHFAGSEPTGQVWTYDAQSARRWATVPEETGKQTHFYTVELADGTLSAQLELLLGQFETRAAPIYDRLLSGEIPEGQAKWEFAEFLALMYLRTPTMRRISGELIGQRLQVHQYAYATNPGAFDGLMRKLEQEKGQPIPPEIREAVREMMLDPASHHEISIPQARTLAAFKPAEAVTNLLFEMTWSVVVPKHGFFITSDNPVVKVVDPKTVHPSLGDGGFKNKTSRVSFPLSPRHLLLMTWDTAMPTGGLLRKDGVDRLNRARAHYSERFLFAHLSHNKIARLAREFRDCRPGFAMRGFGPKRFAKVSVTRR